MTRHEDINIEGWWTINFMGNYDGLGCVICRIIEIKEYEPQTDGDKKYLFDLRDKNDIHKYKFKQAIGIVNQNEIKDWNIIDDDGANYSNELEKVTGQISLDNRFIKLYSLFFFFLNKIHFQMYFQLWVFFFVFVLIL